MSEEVKASSKRERTMMQGMRMDRSISEQQIYIYQINQKHSYSSCVISLTTYLRYILVRKHNTTLQFFLLVLILFPFWLWTEDVQIFFIGTFIDHIRYLTMIFIVLSVSSVSECVVVLWSLAFFYVRKFRTSIYNNSQNSPLRHRLLLLSWKFQVRIDQSGSFYSTALTNSAIRQ